MYSIHVISIEKETKSSTSKLRENNINCPQMNIKKSLITWGTTKTLQQNQRNLGKRQLKLEAKITYNNRNREICQTQSSEIIDIAKLSSAETTEASYEFMGVVSLSPDNFLPEKTRTWKNKRTQNYMWAMQKYRLSERIFIYCFIIYGVGDSMRKIMEFLTGIFVCKIVYLI